MPRGTTVFFSLSVTSWKIDVLVDRQGWRCRCPFSLGRTINNTVSYSRRGSAPLPCIFDGSVFGRDTISLNPRPLRPVGCVSRCIFLPLGRWGNLSFLIRVPCATYVFIFSRYLSLTGRGVRIDRMDFVPFCTFYKYYNMYMDSTASSLQLVDCRFIRVVQGFRDIDVLIAEYSAPLGGPLPRGIPPPPPPILAGYSSFVVHP